MSQTLEALIVELRANIKGFQASLKTAASDVSRFSSNADKSMQGFEAAIGRARNALLALGAGAAAIKLGKGIVDAGVQMQALQNKMQAATASSEIAAEAMAYVRSESERLGLSIVETASGFAGFAASSLRAGLTFGQTKEIFTGVSEAATSMHLSVEQTSLIFKALEQIAGKGTVAMEELRGQLGDVLPGAFEIAAKAMGKTTAEFTKMVSNGQVAATDFLPKFGAAIREELGGSVEEASKSAQAAFNRLGNAWLDLQAKMSASGFIDAITLAVNELTSALNDPQTVEGLKNFATMLGEIVVAATKAAAAVGNFFADSEKNREALLNATKGQSFFSLFDPQQAMEDAKKTEALRDKVLADFVAKQKEISAKAAQQSTGSKTDGYTLGKIAAPVESDAQKKAREKLERQREQLRSQVDSVNTTNARETDPQKAAALEIEKQQKVFEEALDKKAITEQEYRDAQLQAEMAYQDRLTDIRQKAADQEINMREQATNSAVALLQVFANKNKAIAIALLAFQKAKSIAEAIIATHVAATTALIYDPTGATSARVTAWGYANVALIAATGIAQLASMGSGGGSSGGVSAGSSSGGGDSGVSSSGSSQGNPGPGKSVYITLNGTDAATYSKTQIRQLLESINDALSDGSQLRVAVGS